MRKRIPYQPYLKTLARNLRNNSTQSEIILWVHLKGKQMRGYDFHRQVPIDHYIADFYCPALQLAIELDGITHQEPEAPERDARKDRRLQELGVRVIRFDDEDVFQNIGWVLEEIENTIDDIERGIVFDN